jgi:ABC-type phosphate transport system substrate-binding protein
VLKKITLALLTLTLAVPQSLDAQRYVVVVNPRNPVVRLSHLQISKIFLGKLQAWDFNGTLQPVSPVDLRTDSPLRAVFSQNVLRKSVSETAAYWRQELYAGRNVPPPEQSETDALETVRTVIGAIAYVSDKADLKGVKVVTVQ